MNTLKILIVEDSQEVALQLSNLLSKLLLTEISFAYTFYEAVRMIREKNYDIIFLDMLLDTKLGTDLLSIHPNLPPVIVLSAYPDYALKTYEFDSVVDYLQKPVEEIRLLKAINRATGLLLTQKSISDLGSIYLKVGRQVNRFVFNKINYIQAYGIYSKVHHNHQIVVVNESITALEDLFPSSIFKRVHKSYIVNINNLTGFDLNYFFCGSEKIPIGKTYKTKDLESIFRLLS